MLLNMELVTPKFPNDTARTTELDIQYRTGIVHFYPNLGGQAPIDWEIPYLFPPSMQVSISPKSTVDAGPPSS